MNESKRSTGSPDQAELFGLLSVAKLYLVTGEPLKAAALRDRHWYTPATGRQRIAIAPGLAPRVRLTHMTRRCSQQLPLHQKSPTLEIQREPQTKEKPINFVRSIGTNSLKINFCNSLEKSRKIRKINKKVEITGGFSWMSYSNN